MTVNAKDVYEAYTLLIGDLLINAPHRIKYDANEEDWDQRTEHLVNIGKALDKYFLELGRDMAQHAHCSFDQEPFRAPLMYDGIEEMLMQLQRGANAAREHETVSAE